MSGIGTYRELLVWQKSIVLVTECYKLTARFPDHERFGLTSQLRRAAVSIPANIAEGHGRGSTKSFVHFLWIANGSRTELETHVLIAEQLGFATRSETVRIFELSSEIGRMLTGLRRSLRKTSKNDIPDAL